MMSSTCSTLPESCSAGQPITWELLCELEPRLLSLYNKAQAICSLPLRRAFCANRTWNRDFRHDLDDLVGFHVGPDADSRLRTFAAHNIARTKIYNALPDCRNCSCVDVGAIIEARRAVRRRARERIASR
jgi:hypothetical protein